MYGEQLLKINANLERLQQTNERAFNRKIDNADATQVLVYRTARDFAKSPREFQQQAIRENWDIGKIVDRVAQLGTEVAKS